MMTDTNDLIKILSKDAISIKPAPHPYKVMVVWMAALAIYVSLMAGYFGLRADWAAKLHDILFMAELGSLGLLIVSSALSALLLSYPDLYQKHWMVFAPAPVCLFFVSVVLVEWLRDVPPAPMPDHGMNCLVCISSLSLVPAIALFYRMKKFASTHYYMAGAIALVAAFSVGAFVLRLSEKTDSIMHIVEWHYLPMLGVALIGIFLGKVLLRW